MAIKSSGKLSFGSDIEREFGRNSKRSLGEYRIKQTVGKMVNLPLDENIPTRSTPTGPGITPTPDNNTTIRFSDFYGKKLNIILDYKKNQHYETPSSIKKYKDKRLSGGDEFTGITVVGGFKQLPPPSTSGKKVYIHVSAIIGGQRGNRNFCSLRTGTWPNDTDLRINIGNGAGLIGAGGEGGQGGGPGSDGENGGDGTSALGIQYNVTKLVVQSGGFIRAGGGGGGGGGGAKSDTNGDNGGDGGDGAGASPGTGQLNTGTGQFTGDSGAGGTTGDSTGDAGGGGGGGGGCYPGGSVGGGGAGASRSGGSAEDGQDGSTSKGGNGGQGSAGGERQKEGNGGIGGNNGYAIIRENANISVITGTISGDNVTGTVAT